MSEQIMNQLKESLNDLQETHNRLDREIIDNDILHNRRQERLEGRKSGIYMAIVCLEKIVREIEKKGRER